MLDESLGLSDSEEEVINFFVVFFESSNDEEGVVGIESDYDLFDDEFDRFLILSLFEGSLKIVLEVLVGYFYWFFSYLLISKSVLLSFLSYEYFNVFFLGNNLLFIYE